MARITDKEAALIADEEAQKRHDGIAAPLSAVARTLEALVAPLEAMGNQVDPSAEAVRHEALLEQLLKAIADSRPETVNIDAVVEKLGELLGREPPDLGPLIAEIRALIQPRPTSFRVVRDQNHFIEEIVPVYGTLAN